MSAATTVFEIEDLRYLIFSYVYKLHTCHYCNATVIDVYYDAMNNEATCDECVTELWTSFGKSNFNKGYIYRI
tara:strand:- start:573 stop:791 length:219 start_codon:yes stop_codon:yes gene_type:complete